MLVGDRSAHRGLVQVERSGDLGAGQRLQRRLALGQEVPLALDGVLGDALQGVPPVVQLAEERPGSRGLAAARQCADRRASSAAGSTSSTVKPSRRARTTTSGTT